MRRSLLLLPLAALLQAMPLAAAAPRTHVVVIDAMKFGPVPATLRAGDTIVWDNRDVLKHTATARDGSFDLRLQPGKKGRTVLRKAGNLAIWCIYHPMMRTTLRVAAS